MNKQKWYSEENLVDRVARFTPWLAPLIPATFAFQSATNETLLNQPLVIGLLIAATIEGLGLASVHTSISLFEYIKLHDKQKPKAEAVIMLLMALFYLAIVVVVNIILDLHHPTEIIAAKALLSLVSIPAAVTLSIRQLHKSKLTNEQEQKAELSARGRLGALTKKYNELEKELERVLQTNNDLLQEQKQAKQNQEKKQKASKPEQSKITKRQTAVAVLVCPDCGKEVNGVKGLNGHKAWCKGKPTPSKNGYHLEVLNNGQV